MGQGQQGVPGQCQFCACCGGNDGCDNSQHLLPVCSADTWGCLLAPGTDAAQAHSHLILRSALGGRAAAISIFLFSDNTVGLELFVRLACDLTVVFTGRAEL